jgi:glycosyltransferase involved in cell wall biosynthesis
MPIMTTDLFYNFKGLGKSTLDKEAQGHVQDGLIDNCRYVIITPARNEELYIEETIKSVINQSVRPLEWIIVNDGSTDGMPAIISEYARKYDWINLVNMQDRGFRSPGAGVMEAFYSGYSELSSTDWDYIVKLDADLKFDRDYFEKCLWKFRKNPDLGIGGGSISSYDGKGFIVDKAPRFHVRGATKIYRKECWQDIQGLIVERGWDTIDELKANMLGWKTESFPDISLVQSRKTGHEQGALKDQFKNGFANYITCYHPLFMITKCLYRLFRKPYIIGSLSLFAGYVYGFVTRKKILQDKELIRYIRSQQLRKLTLRKTLWR